MDGIYFLVLLAFGALTGALLALCAALGANLPSTRGNSDDAAAPRHAPTPAAPHTAGRAAADRRPS
ncbi:MAG: hypothetical protein CL858_03645 [Cupriavidus sp.]|uniref:hypothetical protein n=1 Tax=Cupriavidus pauculus TaxID=82633 RepID=UPI000C621FDC|nr:hypothetical protein [Cupriavidus pauculus]MBU64550.1 hypothetical protein [Cupriavidus sp.]MBY4731556.1 hypothetical protein [Cupriavidus pauculus]